MGQRVQQGNSGIYMGKGGKIKMKVESSLEKVLEVFDVLALMIHQSKAEDTDLP